MEQTIAAQTIHNEDYDGDITLSSKKGYDELWGGTLPEVTSWFTTGVYAPIHLETDKHLYKGQIIINPRGVKSSSSDANIQLQQYAFQTRNYLNYSDFDEYEEGRLLLPIGRMKPGDYRLIIVDPRAEPPLNRHKHSFKIEK